LDIKRAILMNMTTTLAEISSLSVDDRIKLVQAIWDTHPDLTEAQKKDLDRRVAELDDSPDQVLTWEEIKRGLRDDP
jgi:putative addiction module component (TIGR02574 family)